MYLNNDDYRLINQFKDIIKANKTIMNTLSIMESLNLSDCWLTGGAIRCAVWNWIHNYESDRNLKDLDIVYYSKEKIKIEHDGKFVNSVPMEFTNQAFIHEWYEKKYGINLKPLVSVEDGLYLWSDSCNSILLRRINGGLEIKSLTGLSDLCNGIIRPIKERYEKYGLPASDYYKRLEKWDVINNYPKIKILYE
ncbi:MAG: hypothetical protein K0R54_1840 [Clostridiaceae bacterium]|jgi:hypothetical protein|nr:hypothetical protein [Clostridiaceae bacterium]